MQKMNLSKLLTNKHLSCFICFLLIHVAIISCNSVSNVNSSIEVYEYKDSVVITPSPKFMTQEELSKSSVRLALGKIQEYKGKDKIENNLLSQIATYNSALFRGDKQNSVRYLYRDAIVYFRKFYPGYSDEAITDEFYKSISHSYVEQQNRFNEHGIDFSVVIPNFVRKITQGDNVFIVFNITSNVCSKTLYTHFADFEQTLGISHNGGKNWSFITINEDTPNILRLSNSEEIIDAVMGY